MSKKIKNSMVELCKEFGISYVITDKYISVMNEWGETALFTDADDLAEWINY
ncbi:MAG: hypothetical protein JHC33_05025 [Ignisphaera sp.]|nr:hypothetical protein [Ignisphaera sp.]